MVSTHTKISTNRGTAVPGVNSFIQFMAIGIVLTLATVGLGLSGIQHRVESSLPVKVLSRTIDLPQGALEQPLATPRAKEKSASTWHVAPLPGRGESLRWLRLSTDFEGEIVDPGVDANRPPIIATWFTRPDNARQNVAPHPLSVGLLDKQSMQTIRAWPQHATEVVAAVMPRGARGDLSLSRFSVDIVTLSASYLFLLGLLTTGWAVLAYLAVRYVRPRLSGPAAIVPIALATLIAVAATFSHDVIDGVIRPIVSLMHGTRAGVSLVATFKIGHALAFALLIGSLIAVRRQLDLTALHIVPLGLLLAAASEAAQTHLPGRTAQLSDFGIDMLGMLAGYFLWRLGQPLHQRFLMRSKATRDSRPETWAGSACDVD